MLYLTACFTCTRFVMPRRPGTSLFANHLVLGEQVLNRQCRLGKLSTTNACTVAYLHVGMHLAAGIMCVAVWKSP